MSHYVVVSGSERQQLLLHTTTYYRTGPSGTLLLTMACGVQVRAEHYSYLLLAMACGVQVRAEHYHSLTTGYGVWRTGPCGTLRHLQRRAPRLAL